MFEYVVYLNMSFDSILSDLVIFVYGALSAMTLFLSFNFFYASRDRAIRETTQLRTLTGVAFAWLAFTNVYGLLYLYEPFFSNDRISILVTDLDLMIFPLMSLLLTNVTHRKPVDWSLVLSHYVPFWVTAVVGLVIGKLWVIAVEVALTAVYVLVMSIIMFRAGLVYNRYIRHQYSSLKGRDVSNIFLLSILYVVLTCGWVLFKYFGNTIALLACNVIDLIFFPVLGLDIKEIVSVRELSKFDSEKMDEMYVSEINWYEIEFLENIKTVTDTDDSKVKEFKQKLVDVCEKKKLFVDEDLTRDDLCREMGTNHTYFTQLLKMATGKNFNEYINSLRIDYAEKLLADVAVSLNDIPAMVGFSSKSSYYSAFKSRHNCTPLQYRNANGNA